jgi:hypothetical protein
MSQLTKISKKNKPRCSRQGAMLSRGMKYIYWAFLAVLFVIGVGVSVYFGIQPRPVPKIKPSQTETPERLGEAIAQRLWAEIKDTPLIFLGVDPDRADDMRVWLGFLESLEPAMKYSTVLMEPRLTYKDMVPKSENIDINQQYNGFVEWLKIAMEHNRRVAVIVPTLYSSQAIPENPVNRLKKEMANPAFFISLSIVEPTLEKEEESKAAYPCVTGGGDTRGLGSFGCLIQGKSRSLYLKKFESGKYLGLMDQIGGTDYLVLFRRIP